MKKNFAALLFEWPIKTAPRLALPFFILLAVFLHLSTIYLFDIVYQPPHVSKPLAAQVFFLLPKSVPSQELAAWLQGNDPAIFSPLRTTQINRPNVSSDIYQLHEPSPKLHSLPPVSENSSELPLLPTNEPTLPSSLLTLEHTSTTATSPTTIRSTTVRLLDNLATRMPASAPSLGHPMLPKEITTPLPPTLLKVNINAAGTPRHVMILQSSGDSSADEAATHWLMTSHFAPAAEESWGSILILWGN